MTTISAVVANYNYAAFVASAIESLLAQTISFDQIVVVDDGSTDESLAVIRTFEPSIEVVAQQNGGQLSAVWAGLQTVRTDYVYVLDSDDIAEPTLVAELLPRLQANPVKVQFQLRAMNGVGQDTESVFPSFPSEYSSRKMILDNAVLGFYVCPPTSGNVFRRDFLVELAASGLLKERAAFDGVPALAAPYFGEVVALNEVLARYRVHERSISQWGRPTVSLLLDETSEHVRRWHELRQVLARSGMHEPATEDSTVYTLERSLMRDVLTGRRASMGASAQFVHRVLRSQLSTRHKVLLAGWAIVLPLLPNGQARKLVISRRAPTQRGRLLRIVANLARARHPGSGS